MQEAGKQLDPTPAGPTLRGCCYSGQGGILPFLDILTPWITLGHGRLLNSHIALVYWVHFDYLKYVSL